MSGLRETELLNAELDGELDAGGQAELERALAGSAELRLRREALRAMTDLLKEIPDRTPPQDLRARILDQITVPRLAHRQVTVPAQGLLATLFPVLRYGGVFAAGMLVALALSDFGEPMPGASADLRQMTGTMAQGAHLKTGEPLATRTIDLSEISGRIVLTRADGLYLVEFDLEGGLPVELSLELPEGWELSGFAQPGRVADSVRLAGDVGANRLEVNAAVHYYGVFLRPVQAEISPEGSSEIAVSLRQDGRRLYGTSLNPRS